MKLKTLAATAALAGLGLGGAGVQAATFNWGVHLPLQVGINVTNGSFIDYFLFEINPGPNTVSSTAVANNLGDGVILNILNGRYSLWSAGSDGLVGGLGSAADSQLSVEHLFSGTTGNLTNSNLLTAGHYYYKVTGDGAGLSGGFYSLTSTLTSTVPAVPEPETYAMMLAGLAAIGYVARRRKPK
jgi:hypothetical protein